MEQDPTRNRAPGEPRTAGPAGPRDHKGSGSRVIWWLAAIVLAFLAGFGWQYYRAMTIEDRLEQTEQELAVERLRVGLAQAAVAAQSGDFESARRLMSDFFTSTQARLEELPAEVRTVAEDLLRERDAVITGLSRSDARTADALYDMLQRFRLSLGEEAVPLVPSPATMDTGTAGG